MNKSYLDNVSVSSNALYNDLNTALQKFMIFFNINENERNSIMNEKVKPSFKKFDVDEQTIIKAFVDNPPNRKIFLSEMENQLSKTTDENIKEILIGIIEKVKNMSDEQFSCIDLSEALDQSDIK